MSSFLALLHSPLAHSVFIGWLGAAGADMHVLMSTGQTKGWVALKDFDWNKASFRWLIGIGIGLFGGLGFNVVGVS